MKVHAKNKLQERNKYLSASADC